LAIAHGMAWFAHTLPFKHVVGKGVMSPRPFPSF
jgi:hypothetical protein